MRSGGSDWREGGSQKSRVILARTSRLSSADADGQNDQEKTTAREQPVRPLDPGFKDAQSGFCWVMVYRNSTSKGIPADYQNGIGCVVAGCQRRPKGDAIPSVALVVDLKVVGDFFMVGSPVVAIGILSVLFPDHRLPDHALGSGPGETRSPSDQVPKSEEQHQHRANQKRQLEDEEKQDTLPERSCGRGRSLHGSRSWISGQ